MKKQEYALLDDFLYEAIFIPAGNGTEGIKLPDRSIINQPELQVYISDFGNKKDDICFVALVEENIIGAL